jgi:hypothetical protein
MPRANFLTRFNDCNGLHAILKGWVHYMSLYSKLFLLLAIHLTLSIFHLRPANADRLSDSGLEDIRKIINIYKVNEPKLFSEYSKQFQYIQDRCDEAKIYHKTIHALRHKPSKGNKKEFIDIAYIESRDLGIELSGRFNSRAIALEKRGSLVISELRRQLPAQEILNVLIASPKSDQISIVNLKLIEDIKSAKLNDPGKLVANINAWLDLLEKSFTDYDKTTPFVDRRNFHLCSALIADLIGGAK